MRLFLCLLLRTGIGGGSCLSLAVCPKRIIADLIRVTRSAKLSVEGIQAYLGGLSSAGSVGIGDDGGKAVISVYGFRHFLRLSGRSSALN